MAGFFAQPVPSVGDPRLVPNEPGGDFNLPPPPNPAGATSIPTEGVPHNANEMIERPQGGDPGEIAAAYARSLGPPSPENLAKTAAYMRSLGYDIREKPGSDGFVINGRPYDLIQNFKGGGPQSWQSIGDPVGAGGGSIGGMGGYNAGKSPSDIIKGTPGFQFRFDEGLDALQRSAAAKGTLLTGGTLKDIVNYGQNFASNEFQQQWMRDMDLARLGAGAAGALGDFGSAYGRNMADAANAYGNAAAGGSAAQGNIWGNVAGQVGGVISKKPWEKPVNPNSPTAPGGPTAGGGGSFSYPPV